MTDDFLDDVPSYDTPQQRPYQEAWVKYILEFPMPDLDEEREAKDLIIKVLKPILNGASRTNLDPHEISNLLWQYDNLWIGNILYDKKRWRRSHSMIVLRRGLRTGYYQELTRGKNMGQMNMIFQPKQNIFQRLLTQRHERKARFFKSGEPELEEQM